MKIKLLILFVAVAMAACQRANDKNPALLGQWQGTEWLIFDKPSNMDASQVHFEFKEDGTYMASFGNQYQKGNWRTEKDKLYTTETGKEEIMVKFGVQEQESSLLLTKENIKKMVADGKTETLIDFLNQDSPDIILLKSQFNEGKKQFDMGLIEHAEWSRTQARINYAIVEMAESLASAKSETIINTVIQFEMNRGGQKETLKMVKR